MILFIFYILYQLGLAPLLTYLKINPPPLIQNIPETLGGLLMLITIIIIVMFLLILGVGYLVFTGWKHRKQVALPLKLIITFILGVITFILAGSISILIKIPIIPIFLATTIIWVVLRLISSHIGSAKNYVSLEEAVEIVKSLHIKLTGSSSVEIVEAELQPSDNTWLIRIGDLEYRVDASSGDVVKWGRSSRV
jgi:hypothetical protein